LALMLASPSHKRFRNNSLPYVVAQPQRPVPVAIYNHHGIVVRPAVLGLRGSRSFGFHDRDMYSNSAAVAIELASQHERPDASPQSCGHHVGTSMPRFLLAQYLVIRVISSPSISVGTQTRYYYIISCYTRRVPEADNLNARSLASLG